MRKMDKKIDNQLRQSLTHVCDAALKDYLGFEWLTHRVNYSDFPHSLRIICVFDTNHHLSDFMAAHGREHLNSIIQQQLSSIRITINSRCISYDTEENCQYYNNGKWVDRLSG